MHLLERTTPHALLSSTFQQVQAGQGSVALITGEAGIGKTAFLTTFTSGLKPPVQVLWGRRISDCRFLIADWKRPAQRAGF